MILFVTRRRCRSLDRLCRCPSGDLQGRSSLWKRDMFSFLITKFSAHYLLLSVTSLEQWKLPFSRMRLDQTKSGLADCPCDCVLCVNDMPKQPKIVHSCVIAVLRCVCVSSVPVNSISPNLVFPHRCDTDAGIGLRCVCVFGETISPSFFWVHRTASGFVVSAGPRTHSTPKGDNPLTPATECPLWDIFFFLQIAWNVVPRDKGSSVRRQREPPKRKNAMNIWACMESSLAA